jgi:predicted nucleotidyltransferase
MALSKLKNNGVDIDYDEIVKVCKKYHISELSIFGSSLRKDFASNSDVDILVSYHNKAKISLFDEAQLMNEFTVLFNRPVDICDIRGLKNPIRREEILSTREVVYIDT